MKTYLTPPEIVEATLQAGVKKAKTPALPTGKVPFLSGESGPSPSSA